jgi:hypothetical protein
MPVYSDEGAELTGCSPPNSDQTVVAGSDGRDVEILPHLYFYPIWFYSYLLLQEDSIQKPWLQAKPPSKNRFYTETQEALAGISPIWNFCGSSMWHVVRTKRHEK